MASQKRPIDDLSLDELLSLASSAQTKKEILNLEKLTDREIVGCFLKEKKFKPYRKKLTHLIIIYNEYTKWESRDELLSIPEFRKHLNWYYKPIIKNKEYYYYTRFTFLQNRKSIIKRLKNEFKESQKQRSSEEE